MTATTCQPRLAYSALAACAALRAISGATIFCVHVAAGLSAYATWPAASALFRAKVKAGFFIMCVFLGVCMKVKGVRSCQAPIHCSTCARPGMPPACTPLALMTSSTNFCVALQLAQPVLRILMLVMGTIFVW